LLYDGWCERNVTMLASRFPASSLIDPLQHFCCRTAATAAAANDDDDDDDDDDNEVMPGEAPITLPLATSACHPIFC